MVQSGPAHREGSYIFASPGKNAYQHTHTVKLKNGKTVETGQPIGHYPAHAHELPDGTITSDILDGDAFRTGWLSRIMSSSFGDWGDLDFGTGALVAGGVTLALIIGYVSWKQWQSFSPEERADARRHQERMYMVQTAGRVLRR